MNKYAIYTEGEVYPVLEKDGQYYIGVPNTGHFSGDWKFLGVRERLKNNRVIIKPEDALKITDWQFKNGSPRYQVVDLDHGTVRTWAGTADNQQLRSFDIISDNGFNLATKTDNDDEIVLEEEASQASGVASGVNGKIDSFPINPKEMEAQRLEESEDNIFNAREELINYLNQNTKYEWDANESYDNCAITESETDYIEVFVDIKDGNKIYTVDNYSYNSLEELVKNMPVLFTDEDEDYDYNSNWEDLDESKNDKNLDWIYDENEKLYHCEIDNWYFNIYELEDGTYNLIVDYDEDELQDLDDIFDTLEEAKKKAQEIFNKGISEYNDTDFAGFEYETESKDLTKTLYEMALLEDYEDDISPQKQKFIEFCKDKIEDLGDIEIDEQQYHKLMHTEGIREFEDLYIVADLDNYENENLIAINNENKIVINTPMIDCNGYAGTMQFDKIDKKFYDQLMDFWDDIYMDEMIEED